MFGRRKVLFLKKLQKSFVFLQKTPNTQVARGKFLYNSPVFGEILWVFRLGLAQLGHCFKTLPATTRVV